MFYPELSDVIYVPEFQSFVAIGMDTVMVSNSGVVWNVLGPPPAKPPPEWGGGTILQSRTPSTPPQFNLETAKLLPDGTFALALDKTPGTTVSVESSLDLRNWQPVKSVTNWIGRVEALDQGKNRSQFYRAKAF